MSSGKARSRAQQPRPPRPAAVVRQRTDTVCVAFIHPGQCSAYFTTSMIAMLLHDQNTDRHIIAMLNEWSSANVSATRNELTRIFVDEKPDAEWLLWIDADMAWDHDALDRLLASADPVERPLVGGLCFGMNKDGLFPTIYHLVDKLGTLTTLRVNDYPPDAMYPCSATGAAFLLIHRSVLQAMKDKAFNHSFPWFQETELGGMPAGEDITFCLRAQLLKFPVHVNTAVKIGHHKSRLLTEEAFREQCPIDPPAESASA